MSNWIICSLSIGIAELAFLFGFYVGENHGHQETMRALVKCMEASR